jgi:hypothetical protein
VLEITFVLFAERFPAVLDRVRIGPDLGDGDGPHQRAETIALWAKALVGMVDRGEIELEEFMTEGQLRALEELGDELLDVDSDLDSVLAVS